MERAGLVDNFRLLSELSIGVTSIAIALIFI
jgi:hypothetical protein